MEPCRRPRHRAGDPWLVAPDHRGDTRDGFVAGIRASGGSAQQHGFCAAVVGAHSGEERTCRSVLKPLISGAARDLTVRRPP